VGVALILAVTRVVDFSLDLLQDRLTYLRSSSAGA
jgi:hypothetical protein